MKPENQEQQSESIEAEQITTVQVVPIPLEIYSDIIEILQELPYKTVGKLLHKMGSLRPVDATVTNEVPKNRE